MCYSKYTLAASRAGCALYGTADGAAEVISDAVRGCLSEIKTDALARQERGHAVLTQLAKHIRAHLSSR